MPANEYNFREPDAHITYSAAFEEESARLYAGISISEWDALPGTRAWIDPNKGGRSKCDLVVLYRMSNWITAAMDDVAAKKMEHRAR